jgi:hypothetical protein
MSSRILSLLFVGSLLACSSSGGDATTTDTGTTADGAIDTGAAVDTGMSEDTGDGPCMEPIDEQPEGSQCVKLVSGKVLDTTGAPVKGKTTSVCGSTCYYGKTGSDGTFTVPVNSHIVLADVAASVHGRPDFASLLIKLPTGSGENFTLPDMIVPALPATGNKIPIDDASGKILAATKVVGGDVTLSFEAGTKADLDLEDVADTVTGNQLRIAKVETKDFPPFAKDAGVTVLYAANPFDSKYDKKVGVEIANTGMADGPVEFVILGEEYLAMPTTAGLPLVVATGTVSGGTAKTDAGQGLNILTWIGVRPKK